MSSLRRERKETQRERLLAGMLFAAKRRGYAGANIAQVIAHAGVSRPTFYAYFSDKDDCFLAVHREISSELVTDVARAVAEAPPERAVQAGCGALLDLARVSPERAGFLVNETMAGGRRALDARDRLVGEIAAVIDNRHSSASPNAQSPDLPTKALVGGICELLAPRLRRNEYDFDRLALELEQWISSYDRPSAQHRWRTLEPGPRLVAARHVSELAPGPPPPLSRGRPAKMSPSEIARHQRERIVYATAKAAAKKGYASVTIADITRTAGVDRRVFYAHFHDKQQAFLAAHELGFQQTMAVCSRAFFAADSWPDRIWEGLRAKTHFNASYPLMAHISYVEAHAVGRPAIHRVDDSRAAFNIFLQEGFRHSSVPPPSLALDGISATIFEICYDQARRGRIDEMPRLMAHIVYLVLAPFLGPEQANEFVDAKVEQDRALEDVEQGKLAAEGVLGDGLPAGPAAPVGTRLHSVERQAGGAVPVNI